MTRKEEWMRNSRRAGREGDSDWTIKKKRLKNNNNKRKKRKAYL